jgi:hypothetical protein
VVVCNAAGIAFLPPGYQAILGPRWRRGVPGALPPTAAAARVDRLTQSILAQAFRGELAPTEAELARAEGRRYEPAGQLLARMRAERKAAAGAWT